MLEKETGQEPEYYFKELLTAVVGEEEEEKRVTWDKIVGALREVGESQLAGQLAEKYGRRGRGSAGVNEGGGGDIYRQEDGGWWG